MIVDLESVGIAAGIIGTLLGVALALRGIWKAELAKAKAEAASDEARDERISATRADLAEFKAEVRGDLAELGTKIDHAVDLSQQSLRVSASLEGKLETHTKLDASVLAEIRRAESRFAESGRPSTRHGIVHKIAAWFQSWHL